MKNKYYYFIILSILTLAFSYLTKILLNIDDLLMSTLTHQYTQNQIQEILSFQDKWEWLSYLIIPILLLIKILIIATVISLGCFLFNKDITYRKVFTIVTKAEFVFILVGVCKMLWFYVFQQDYTLEDIQNFYPLSALNIIGSEGLEKWFIYPFQALNLFELVYWFVLAYLLRKELKITTDKGFSIIASSYGVALLIWVVGIMFFTLNMS